MTQEMQFTPVETGDLSEIPPDAPEGEWTAECEIKKAATSKDSYPMLILNWSLKEAATEGNEAFCDDNPKARVSDFLVFFPAGHAGAKMSKQKLKTLCENLQIDIPSTTKIESWDDLADFTDALAGVKTRIWTSNKVDKGSGEVRTNVFYSAPRSFGGGAAAAEEEEKPKAKAKAAPAKKVNGRR